jgi:hypothetical protein
VRHPVRKKRAYRAVATQEIRDRIALGLGVELEE